MKAVRVLLVFLVAAGVVSGKVCFPQEEESGVIVYGVSEVSSSEEISPDLQEKDSLDPELAMAIEITGSRFGNSVTSETVVLSEEMVISHADASMGQGITIVQVDANGVERQVFGLDRPEQAVGEKLSPGRYKVYPDNLNRDFEIGKITAVISVEAIRKDKK